MYAIIYVEQNISIAFYEPAVFVSIHLFSGTSLAQVRFFNGDNRESIVKLATLHTSVDRALGFRYIADSERKHS
jgi:hypothetical protein